MVKIKWIFTLVTLFFGNHISGQHLEKYDGVTYSPPVGWSRIEGLGYLEFTKGNSSSGEFGKILLYKVKPSSGSLDNDFEEDWRILIVPEYQPREPMDSSKTSFKSKWNAMIGAVSIFYQNQNQAVVLVTISNGQRKISYVFVSNTSTFERELEEFGSSLEFGSPTSQPAILAQPLIHIPCAPVQLNQRFTDMDILK
ncbi:hypothetical protein [Aquiflexum sp.]|uniref:hypothetical protein n=1 Tax=Aquiflexum sp. TaxID=1872584 RepID=UPI0035930C8F